MPRTRALFWPRGSPLPTPALLSTLAAVTAAAVGVGIGALNARLDAAVALLVLLFVAVILRLASAWPWERPIIRSHRDKTWAKVSVGLDFGAGWRLVLLALLGVIALILFSNLPIFFPGIPNYSVTVAGAYFLLVAAPWLETDLFFGGLWSTVYNGTGSWTAATLGTSGAFAVYHSAVYARAGPFTFVYLFALGLVTCAVDWAPVRWGRAPSTVPGLAIHTALNAIRTAAVCLLGTARAVAGESC